MSDNFFDDFNKKFKQLFKDWTLIGNDMDDFFKDFEENIEIRSKGSRGQNIKEKNYSISYNYSTGMKEPEVVVKGNATKKDIDRFLERIQKRLGNQFLNLSDKKIRMLGTGEKEKEVKLKNYKNPRMSMTETNDDIIYSIEMPGIGESDLKTRIYGNTFEIKAERGDILYKKNIELDLNLSSKPEISADNGLITVKFKKKK